MSYLADGFRPRFDPTCRTVEQSSRHQAEQNPATFHVLPVGISAKPAGPSLKLENRGITSQKFQAELWRKQTIHKNTIAAKLRSIGQLALAGSLESCHTEFTFAVCDGCHRAQQFPNRCDRLYCPECQPRLAHEREKAVGWWAKRIEQPKHVVLTVKNIPDMSRGHIQQLKKWFGQLRRTKFAKHWRGGFYSIEVTNEGNGWHIHIHALVDADYIDQFALSAQWQKVTNGLGRIVKVKDARQKDFIKEVTKYAVKGNQLAAWAPQQIEAFILAFSNLRTFGVFGSLYGKRTEWAEWLKGVIETHSMCECGCSKFQYYSELEWITKDLVPGGIQAPRPPPSLQVDFRL